MMLFIVTMSVGAAASTIGDQCSKDFQKVTTCLAFATGKATTPTKECCTAVSSIRDTDPVCLCYVIQQTHNGSAQIKSLGIQEAKLLQLPTACSLKNSSTSYCPKLLNIPANSPDAAIFTNSTSSTSSPSTVPGTATPSQDEKSNSNKHRPNLAGPTAITMGLAIFIYAFPSGFTFTFCGTRW